VCPVTVQVTQYDRVCCSVLQCVAAGGVMPFVAVCYSVLQCGVVCVEVRCSVLQCVAV